ncbi:unannotated protein [freshwater metagenome]|uniref:Unannotated protein n=1 Tax=freshwater metagenome TaxID=449393 RepID=A0A6J6SP61_9ZZZZ
MALETLACHSTPLLPLHCNSNGFATLAIRWTIGWGLFPIQLTQDLPFFSPITTFGIINTDSSFSEKEKDANKIGPVPLPRTLFAISKLSSSLRHQARAFSKRSGPETTSRLYSPNPIKPSPPRTHEEIASSSSIAISKSEG